MRIDVKHLRGFMAVVDELNFTRAAERLAVAQPALTQWIQFLEREVGTPLLVRTTRRVTLTKAGEAFQREASLILGQLDHAVQTARGAGLEENRKSLLRIGGVGSAMRTIIPDFLTSMRDEHPDIALQVEERTEAELREGLRRGVLDLIVTRGRPRGLICRSKCLQRMPLVLIVPPHHSLSGRKSVALATLHAERFVVGREEAAPDFARQIAQACRKSGFAPVISHYADQMPSIIDLVGRGLGIAIVTADMKAAAERLGCHMVRLSDQRLESQIWAAVPKLASASQVTAMEMLARTGI